MQFRILLTAATLFLSTATLTFGEEPTPSALSKIPGALSFIVVGDWGRDGSPSQRAVASEMAKAGDMIGAKFIISTGDNFYPNGVASVDDPQWQTSFEEVYTDFVLHNDWFVVLGNHDYHGNPQAEVDYTRRSERWHMPARYYTVTKRIDAKADAQFFFIDTTPFVVDDEKDGAAPAAGQDTKEQLVWLQQGLATSKAKWKFVVGHHHIYSGGKRTTQLELEKAIVPLLERYGVSAYINGHEHDLQVIQRHADGVAYLVSGAGSEHRPTGKTEGTLFSASDYGFMTLSLTTDSARVDVVNSRGIVLYEHAFPAH